MNGKHSFCFKDQPGVNLTNILRAAFMHADPKGTKKLLDMTFFALLGPASVKAACRMLMKLTPGLYLNDTKECAILCRGRFNGSRK